jgi:arylsulfatase A-like enzyme
VANRTTSGRAAERAGGGVSPRLLAAISFAALYLLHALAIRIADAVILLGSGNAAPAPLGPPFTLPFLLGEELAIAAALAAVLWAAWRRPLLRALWLAACGAYLLFLSAEQLAYKTFFTHIDYVLYSDCNDIIGLAASIVGLIDGWFWLDAAIALGSIALVASPWRPRPLRALAGGIAARPRIAICAGSAYLGVTLALAVGGAQHGLDRPFPVAFVESYLAARAEQAAEQDALADPPPRTPAARRSSPIPPAEDELARIRAALAAHPGKLNVVWYLMESTSFRDTTLDPAQRYDTTPFLKELAARSLLFDRYHTGVAASTRAFFSIQTGLEPYMDQASDLKKYSQLAVPTLTDTLHDAGWATAFFSSSDTMFESLDSFLSSRKYDVYMDKNLLPPEARAGVSVEGWGVDEEIMIDNALEWVASTRAAGRPFFLNYNAVYPHHPFSVPPAHRALYGMDWGEPIYRARYRASLRYADAALERMYAGLEKLGALEDTLFIVSPDHGEAFGDLHRRNTMHAEYCYEEDSRIFLLVHNPKLLGAPLVTHRLGSHVDLFPTLLEALGVRGKVAGDGQSLIAPTWAEPVLHCFSRRQLSVREGDLKAIVSRAERKVELYDLAADPTEQRDLAPSRPKEAAAYGAALFRWKAESARRLRGLVEAAGLSDDEVAARAVLARKELFAGVRAMIAVAAICPSAGAASCEASGKGRVFTAGQPVSAWVRLQRAGKADLRLEIFGPDGKKVYASKTPNDGAAATTLGPVPGALLAVPGRYKARLSALRSYAVHDSRLIPFEVR